MFLFRAVYCKQEWELKIIAATEFKRDGEKARICKYMTNRPGRDFLFIEAPLNKLWGISDC